MNKQFTTLVAYFRMHSWWEYGALAASMALFTIIAVVNAPRASMWFDEGFSAYMIRFSFAEIFDLTAHDIHPPLYYWLLKLWSMVAGSDDMGLRSFGIVCGIASIIGVFLLVRRLFGRQAALVSVLLVALSPLLIRYSDEARMYSLATAIVVWAVYALIRALSDGSAARWKWWLLHGILVALGMWTHYFTALVWVAIWVWHLIIVVWHKPGLKQLVQRLFTREWLVTYGIAVALFLPWLFIMFGQLDKVQSNGFWIHNVGIQTPINYITNLLYYLEYHDVTEWRALMVMGFVAGMILLIPRAYRLLIAKEKEWFLLIASLAWVPPLLLFVASLPPLKPSFMDRYVLPSAVMAMVFFAIVLVVSTRKWRWWQRVAPVVVLTLMLMHGITNVFSYGNFNQNIKQTVQSRQVVEHIHGLARSPAPLVANSPWMFYELAPYESPGYPVYFLDQATTYNYGSLEMLKRTHGHKIINIKEFARNHPYIWYIGQPGADGTIQGFDVHWQAVQTITVKDPITNKRNYGATLYKITALSTQR